MPQNTEEQCSRHQTPRYRDKHSLSPTLPYLGTLFRRNAVRRLLDFRVLHICARGSIQCVVNEGTVKVFRIQPWWVVSSGAPIIHMLTIM